MLIGVNENPRRDPKGHIKSLEFDLNRKILIVEGQEDRLFLEYINSGNINKGSLIIEIEKVEISEPIEGGNKGRILFFANTAEEYKDRLKFFIDRDYSEYLGEKMPDNIILTDYRDLEGYLYEEDFLDKFIKLGIKTTKINSKTLLSSLYKAEIFGFIRLTSLINNLNLSINKTNEKLSKYIVIDSDFNITVDEDPYLQSVIQNSKTKLKIDVLKTFLIEIKTKYELENKRLIIHGKDVIVILQKICEKLGKGKENIESVFWMSFDASKIEFYDNLRIISNYLK